MPKGLFGKRGGINHEAQSLTLTKNTNFRSDTRWIDPGRDLAFFWSGGDEDARFPAKGFHFMIVSHLKAITQITHVSISLQNLVQPLISCQEVIPNKFHADLESPP